MLGIRRYWDAANLHSRATTGCGLIRSHKLSQVRSGRFCDREASKNVQVLQEVMALIHQVALFWVDSEPVPLQGWCDGFVCLSGSGHWAVIEDALLWLLGQRWNGLSHELVPTSPTPLNQKGVRKPP